MAREGLGLGREGWSLREGSSDLPCTPRVEFEKAARSERDGPSRVICPYRPGPCLAVFAPRCGCPAHGCNNQPHTHSSHRFSPHALAHDGRGDQKLSVRSNTPHSARECKEESKERVQGMVNRRKYFARLIELRSQFGEIANEDDGPFEEKDHPCLVRQITARRRSITSRMRSAPDSRRQVFRRERQAQTAPSTLDHFFKPIPFRDTILSSSLSHFGHVSKLEALDRNSAHCPASRRRQRSPRSAGANPRAGPNHVGPESMYSDASDRHAHRNGTAAVHSYRLLPPPGLLQPAGPPPSASSDKGNPVLSVQKMTPEKKIKKAELKAHVMKLHSVLGSSLQEVNLSVLDVLAQRRELFLLRALHYLGIPYRPGARPRSDQRLGPAALAQKQNFTRAALYLDCCGLVRQCLQDLADKLDIVVGPYNQAYLYDTLPIILAEHELCPGDLIFTQGRYYDENKARPKHDIVHVEIFVGGSTGKGSLGARDRHGAVDIFENFSFESKSYQVVAYHFRSIDTWLGGVCRSWCPEHRWVTAPRQGKKTSLKSGATSERGEHQEDLCGFLQNNDGGWATKESERPNTGGP